MNVEARIQEDPVTGAADLLDSYLPVYDVVLTEHLVVQASPDVVFRTAKEFDFLTTRSALVTALMSARTLPARLLGRPVEAPKRLRLGADPEALPGWLLLGEVPGREVAFGAVGKFWQADIEWRDTPLSEFVAYILRAVLRTIRSDAEMTTAGPVGP